MFGLELYLNTALDKLSFILLIKDWHAYNGRDHAIFEVNVYKWVIFSVRKRFCNN